MFPLNQLITLIFNSDVEIEFRAILCKLLYHLYIDKNPRNYIAKPNLVRIVNED